MKLQKLILTSLLIIQAPFLAAVDKASEARLDEVAEKGRIVMPFSLEKTLHIFSKTEQGGVQQVMANKVSDRVQIDLIQQHLGKIYQQFKQADFSDPKKIHGQNMPGLAALQSANDGDITLQYKQLDNGAEITYTAKKPELIQAIHLWFDAQLNDHARHASTHKTDHMKHMKHMQDDKE